MNGSFDQTKNNRQAEFWSWFQQNETRIWNIDKDREKIARLVLDAIHLVDPGLSFEISKVGDKGKREFIISANGMSGNIPKVESLFLSAPEMPRWWVTKYRPRYPSIGQIKIWGKTIAAEDIHFQVFNDGDKIGILLLFDDYSEDNQTQFIKLGFLLLDRALGEYDVMTKVGFVDYAGRESNLFTDAQRLPELPKVFDDYFKPH